MGNHSLVRKASAKPGETVLVHGASGGAGIASVQIGASLGMKLIGTAGTEKGLELAKSNGASFINQASSFRVPKQSCLIYLLHLIHMGKMPVGNIHYITKK